jgi:Sulfite oxidase and related enzymes
MNRRELLKKGLLMTATGLLLPKGVFAKVNKSLLGPAADLLPDGTIEEQILDVLPGKKPLIKKTFRAPTYETPYKYFNEIFTPNDVFFVRYHLANIPQNIDEKTWKLKISGDAIEKTLELTMEDLKTKFEQVEIVALKACSGNMRGLFNPHVPGVQWGYGAMGNAKWKGVRLKDILNKAGLKANALEVAFNGAETGLMPTTPDFVKSIPVWKAMQEEVIVAYEMNGEPIPYLNGYPLVLVVPGWTATYWMKHLTDIMVISTPLDNFWMKNAYRLSVDKFPIKERFLSQMNSEDMPITEITINSIITNIEKGQVFKLGQPIEIKGLTWDGGYRVKMVEVSVDGGKTWVEAQLGKDYGKFSWRQFSYVFKPNKKGSYTIMVKATNSIGQTQPIKAIWEPHGYGYNAIQKIDIKVI